MAWNGILAYDNNTRRLKLTNSLRDLLNEFSKKKLPTEEIYKKLDRFIDCVCNDDNSFIYYMNVVDFSERSSALFKNCTALHNYALKISKYERYFRRCISGDINRFLKPGNINDKPLGYNVRNTKTSVIHSLLPNSNDTCTCGFSFGTFAEDVEKTTEDVSCVTCKKINAKTKENTKKYKHQREYEFIIPFRPIDLLNTNDRYVFIEDKTSFLQWCVKEKLDLNKPLVMDKQLINKIKDKPCFKSWLKKYGFIKETEQPFDVTLHFKTKDQFNKFLHTSNPKQDLSFVYPEIYDIFKQLNNYKKVLF